MHVKYCKLKKKGSKADGFISCTVDVRRYGSRAIGSGSCSCFWFGGVGSFAAEALARTGIGQITLVDKDIVEASNINRQLIALEDTLGLPKVDVMAQRIRKINPQAEIYSHAFFFNAETCEQFDFKKYDYVVDHAIDTVSAKILLAEHCYYCKNSTDQFHGNGE